MYEPFWWEAAEAGRDISRQQRRGPFEVEDDLYYNPVFNLYGRKAGTKGLEKKDDRENK